MNRLDPSGSLPTPLVHVSNIPSLTSSYLSPICSPVRRGDVGDTTLRPDALITPLTLSLPHSLQRLDKNRPAAAANRLQTLAASLLSLLPDYLTQPFWGNAAAAAATV